MPPSQELNMGEDGTNEDTKNIENKKLDTSTRRKTGTSSFIIGLIVPLIAYYFIIFKLYSSAYGDQLLLANVTTKVAIAKMLLLAVIFSSMYALNTVQMKAMCPNGTKNIVTKVFFSTFIPFLFMLGSVIMAITLMPGWKAPFSNTIGYSLIKNVIYRKLFQLQDWIQDSSGSEKDDALSKFNRRSNRTFFVNELTPENFFTAIESLNVEFKDDEVDVKKNLFKAIIMKDSISEFIWIFITSILTYSLSQIYIIDYSCEPDVAELLNNSEEIEENDEDGDEDEDY